MNRWITKLGTLVAGASLVTGILVSPLAASADLVLSSWLPARHPIVVGAIKPWAKQVSKVTAGRVKVRVLAKSLGAPPAHYDMAVDGVADITYGLHSFTSDDRFARSRVGQFSFIGDDAIAASQAFWDVYMNTLDAQQEHQGVKVLGLFVHGPGVLHNNVRKITQVGDLSGLKIRVPGGYVSELMSDLGSTTLFMSSREVYEKLSRGVIDGVTFTYEALTAFKLTEDIKYSMRVPGGLYNTTWFLVMNQDKWDAISPADKAAIEGISGETFAKLVGGAWNDADKKAIVAIKSAGIEIYDVSPSLLKKVKTSAKKYEQAWSQEVAKDGYDGAAAIKALRSQTGVRF